MRDEIKMGHAYECDKCGLFFPGRSHSRYLPSPKLRDDGPGAKHTGLDLCINCQNDFDRKMYELGDIFQAAARKRAKNGIRSDQGHEESE